MTEDDADLIEAVAREISHCLDPASSAWRDHVDQARAAITLVRAWDCVMALEPWPGGQPGDGAEHE